MEQYVSILILIFLFFLLFGHYGKYLSNKRRRNKRVYYDRSETQVDLAKYSYVSAKRLMNKREFYIYKLITSTAGSKVAVFPKVRLADVLKVNKEYYGDLYREYLNKLCLTEADFLICQKGTHRILGAIDLDKDKTNEEKNFISNAFYCAEMPYVLLGANCTEEHIINALNSMVVKQGVRQ